MYGREPDGVTSRERVTLRLPTALLERVDAVANYSGNRSAAVRAALAAYVDAHVVVGGAARGLKSGARR